MPYVNIREIDINPLSSFDTIENAVLIFGFNFSKNLHATDVLDDEDDAAAREELLAKKYKIYTSAVQFIKDIKLFGMDLKGLYSKPAMRPYVTAYDCLSKGLPVIYWPIDNYINSSASIVIPETSESEAKEMVIYQWLSDPDSIPAIPIDIIAYNVSEWKDLGIPFDQVEDVYNVYKQVVVTSEGQVIEYGQNWAEEALSDTVEAIDNYILSDRINLPFTFITTCGYESISRNISNSIMNRVGSRKDFVYLYDIEPVVSPEDLITEQDIDFSRSNPELINFVYPWGHYTAGLTNEALHMPGSYGYLMAYANSIRSNKPWLAAAGITRGYIPNIRSVDYDISEPYLHAFQGDPTPAGFIENPLTFRVNPIVNFGSNFGKIIFGNRTCDVSNELVFRSFLNVRLLLVYIHKQAFNSSIQHMFEPNDDIVWLSFKQKVNSLLDQMVTGRGLKWYKWYKLQPDTLGQIKAKLVIRPIEAVESFDITIQMTDEDIEVTEG